MARSWSSFAIGEKNACAITVGTIAESTTTVISSENCVRSMIPALRP